MEESTATQHDVTPEEGAVEPDPFAEVPADLGEEEGLPPNVQPGSLGGDNPSELPEAEAEAEAPAAPVEEEAAPDPLAEEPMGGEFMEEPPEPDFEPEPEAAAPPEAEAPPVPADEPPVAEEEPSEGEAATPVEGSAVPPTGEPLAEPEPEAEADVPTTPQEEEPPAEAPPVEEEPPPAPPAEAEVPEGEQPPAAEAKAEPKKRSRKPRKKKAEKGQRGYVILRLSDRTEAVVDGPSYPIWVEAFQREVPIGEKGSKPVTIDSRSAEMALRVAYRRLTENGEASMWLVPVPAKLFKPKHVEGKVPENALTIKVN